MWKRVSEAERRIKTLWGCSVANLGKSIFDDFFRFFPVFRDFFPTTTGRPFSILGPHTPIKWPRGTQPYTFWNPEHPESTLEPELVLVGAVNGHFVTVL